MLRTKPEQIVYLALAFLGGHCESMEKLIDLADCSRGTVYAAVARLIEHGYVTAHKKSTRHGSPWQIQLTEKMI